MPIQRILHMRKPPGFKPAVQRWSAQFPENIAHIHVGYYGTQGPDDDAIAESPFSTWQSAALADAAGPQAHDFVRFVDAAGRVNRILIAYWTDVARFNAWRKAEWNTAFWEHPARLSEPTGYFREELRVVLGRHETIYFVDFAGGVARCPGVHLEKTFESGYWRAARDRIPRAAHDALESSLPGPLSMASRATAGARFVVFPPKNLVVIRSGQYWERCGEEQLAEYTHRIRPRLEAGLEFFSQNPGETGCCVLRYMHHVDEQGYLKAESSVHGIFHSLADLERWAENHATHKAIYAEAFRQLMTYKERRELRTWHEVFVLEGHDQLFEYLNCHPRTGLLPYFDAARIP